MNKSIENTLSSNIGKNFSQSSKTALENAMRTNEAKAKLQIIEKDLNAEEKRRYEQDLAILDIQQKETQEVADRITKLK